MARTAFYLVYVVLLVQAIGGAIAFYRVDPKVLFSELSLQNGFFLGLFILIHLLGVVGAVLAAFRLRWGFLLSIAHHLLMAVGIKVAGTFIFLTHDVISFFVFFLSRFNEYSVTFRWSWGLGTVFAQLARDPRGIYIGVNLIAVASAAYLWWAMKQADAEREALAPRPQRRPVRQAPMDERQQRRAG